MAIQWLVKCEKCGLVQEWHIVNETDNDFFTCFYCHENSDTRKNIIQKINRTPKLGWNELTIIEAMLDSAMHSNEPKRTEKLNKTLGYTRELIKNRKKNSILLNVCEFRETTRTRCNRYPAFEYNGVYLCDKHKL